MVAQTAGLLFSEYICLVSAYRRCCCCFACELADSTQAIMSFPWSYSILGLVPGYHPTSIRLIPSKVLTCSTA